MEFPTKKYDVIYADPPWRYRDKGCNGNVEAHFNTMTIQDICDLPVNDIAANDSVLFMWAVYPLLPEALQVISAWGFEYKSIAFQWIKQNRSGKGYFFGLGRWTRGNTEACLLATKGKPKRANNSISQLVISPIQEHSRKPQEVRERIKKLMGGGESIWSYLQDRQPLDGMRGAIKWEYLRATPAERIYYKDKCNLTFKTRRKGGQKE